MRFSGSIGAELAIAVGLISLLVFPARSMAQTAATPATSQVPGLQCNGTRILDPFKGSLAGPNLPPGLLPIDATVKDKILKSGLPCQENVSTGAQGDLAGVESVGLENLQRGFDFYSWRTFIALNSPTVGTPIDDNNVDADRRIPRSRYRHWHCGPLTASKTSSRTRDGISGGGSQWSWVSICLDIG
jgi:hypothetical protein